MFALCVCILFVDVAGLYFVLHPAASIPVSIQDKMVGMWMNLSGEEGGILRGLVRLLFLNLRKKEKTVFIMIIKLEIIWI